jgi:hypothetical protein
MSLSRGWWLNGRTLEVDSILSLHIYEYIGKASVRSRYSDWLRAGRLRGRSSCPGRVKNFLFSMSSRNVVFSSVFSVHDNGQSPKLEQSPELLQSTYIISVAGLRIFELSLHYFRRNMRLDILSEARFSSSALKLQRH